MSLLITGAAIALVSIGAGYFLCLFTNKSVTAEPLPAKKNPYDKYIDPLTGLYRVPSKAGGE